MNKRKSGKSSRGNSGVKSVESGGSGSGSVQSVKSVSSAGGIKSVSGGSGSGTGGSVEISRTGAILKGNGWLIVCAALILIQLFFSLRFMGRQYLSLDEVSQLGFIAKKNSWGRIVDYYLTSEVTNLPLFPLLAAVWYRVVPYGEGWLRLLTVLLTTLALVFMTGSAYVFRGRRAACLMTLFCCISSFIMHKCSVTFRCHGFWMLFTALTLYCYFRRFSERGQESWKSVITTGFAMMGLAWSHYFGCLMIVYLFLTDVILFIRGQVKARVIASYLMAGFSLLPWFLLMLSRRTMELDAFWPKTPTFESIPTALKIIVSNDEAVFILLIIGVLFSALTWTASFIEGRQDFGEGFMRLSMALMGPVFVIGDYVYSAHINTGGGIFVMRYFLSVTPACLLTVSLMAEDILEAVRKRFLVRRSCLYGTFILFTLIYIGAPNYYHDVKDEVMAPFDNTYGNVRDAIEEGGREYDSDVLIAINANRANADGFEEYYMERGGALRDVHVVSNEDKDVAERLKGASLVYVYQVMKGTPDFYTELMGDEFVQTYHDENTGLYTFERVAGEVK